jgi:hypothetical protein
MFEGAVVGGGTVVVGGVVGGTVVEGVLVGGVPESVLQPPVDAAAIKAIRIHAAEETGRTSE